MSTFTDLDLGSAPNDGTGTALRAGGAIINANMVLAANLTENTTFTKMLGVVLGSYTIVSGAITITTSYILVTGEASGADDLDTISGSFSDGDMLFVKRGAYTITVTENGNISLGAATRILSSSRDRLFLQWNTSTSEWVEVSYSDND